MKPKILFISRAYPPILGGIENQNYGIGNALAKITPTKIIANQGGKKQLPFFLPWLLIRGLFILSRYDAVLFGDGVLAPLGAFWKFFFPRKRYLSIVHGLDITFAYKKSFLGKMYRAVNIPALKNLDKLIMVGNETIAQAVKIGIPKEKCVFIPNGLELKEICRNVSRSELEKVVGMNLTGKFVIFRGGRYVRHKGLEWFIRSVMPKLPSDCVLIAVGGGIAKNTAGDENDYPRCAKAVKELKLENRVKLFLNMPREDMKVIFNGCDLYISPNVKVPGSMEGFGITAIEAGACGRIVLASDMEGLKDAIQDGQNGFLLEPENAEQWIKKIEAILAAGPEFRKDFGARAAKFVAENYTWEKISKRYLEEIEKVIANK